MRESFLSTGTSEVLRMLFEDMLIIHSWLIGYFTIFHQKNFLYSFQKIYILKPDHQVACDLFLLFLLLVPSPWILVLPGVPL